MRDEAPDHLTPSHYIAVDNLWLTPERVIFTGLRQSENPNDVLLIEMYPAQSPGVTRCWKQTVIVAVKPAVYWGDIDISKEFVRKFGTPLTIGQLVFMNVCWIDSECGYLKWYTMIAMRTQEPSIFHNAGYVLRAKVSDDDVVLEDAYNRCENFDYEMTTGSKIASFDITALRKSGWTAGCEFVHRGRPLPSGLNAPT